MNKRNLLFFLYYLQQLSEPLVHQSFISRIGNLAWKSYSSGKHYTKQKIIYGMVYRI